jgi:hypothetical protein
MTRYLFLDNFRGFTNTYIPIVDVNFLVGENSSGKTSVLSLLNLLSTSDFIWAQKFSNIDVNFGHFHDIVSAHSTDRTYFSFGIIDEHETPSGRVSTAMLYTFKEHDGLARLSRFTSIAGQQQLFLRFDGKKAYFKATGIPADVSADGFRNITMPHWVTERSSDGSDYREITPTPGYPSAEQYPLYVPLMMALDQSRKRGEGAREGPLFYARQELVWIAPIRTKPERTYDDISRSDFSSEGTHTPYLIRRAPAIG